MKDGGEMESNEAGQSRWLAEGLWLAAGPGLEALGPGGGLEALEEGWRP